MLEAKLHFDERLIRRSVWLFMKRTIGIPFMLLIVAFGIWHAKSLIDGDRSVTTLLFTAMVAVFCVFVAYGSWAHLSLGMKKLRALDASEALLRAEEHQFSMISKMGTATMPWKVIEQLWKFEDMWLILYSRSQFSTLPLSCLSPEMQAFILERIKSAGGKIVG
jgi:hypothetical protein